ncbi:substrate-binding domain-containing protein [Curvivirga sp.]|uniref:substrate-binding domain-containing protein n=1 Tax=Curvivirga sp. TaxID=2856848 RepID=UPI003B5C734D
MFRHLKKSFLHFSLFMALLIMAACQDEDTSNQSNDNISNNLAKPRIALVMKTHTNPFFISMEQGARQAEKELNLQLVVRTAAEETSIYQQIDIVHELTRSGEIDAIVIAPGDSVELLPALKAAQDQGIKIVNIDNKLDQHFAEKFGLEPIPFISVDNEAAAYLSAKYISDKIKTPTKVVILEGIPTAANAQARKAGAIRAFEENPNITIVASQSAYWKIDEAYNVVHDFFLKSSDIQAIFAANDMMAIGAIRYLEEHDLHIPVAGFDAIEEAKNAIKSGKMEVTIDQRPSQQGYMGVKTAFEMLNGISPSQEILIDVRVLNAENLN